MHDATLLKHFVSSLRLGSEGYSLANLWGLYMEDGPEALEGVFVYNDKRYVLEEREPDRWHVTDENQRYLGSVLAVRKRAGNLCPEYVADAIPTGCPTEDRPRLIEDLIDRSTIAD